jgi:GNAT superfamily N-acetyltransferase
MALFCQNIGFINMNINIREVSRQNIKDYSAILNQTFGKKNFFSTEYLEWLYYSNPQGNVVGFDAYCNNELAAHYVCIPAFYYVDGRVRKYILSLNTATHPSFQGKGLFIKLANCTYEKASLMGFEGVIGVANSNSTHGFIKKLGFDLVKSLDAYISFSDFTFQPEAGSFYKFWNIESINWRCSNPNNKVTSYFYDNSIYFYAKVYGGLIRSCTELSLDLDENLFNLHNGPHYEYVPKIFIGSNPKFRGNRAINIPDILKPAPLNFIYKNFLGYNGPHKDDLYINFMDFDAF